ncbi:MAG: serine/threonine-protein kinase [Bryobacteraceae bacterium]
MAFLDDRAIERLRDVLDEPDLGGTRYELLAKLGRGGMGAVFRVRDTELEREVALKVLVEGSVPALDEAKMLARLEHPGIVPVHDAGILADGRAFFVMKLVRGERIDIWARTTSLAEVLRAFQKICEAVAFAHAQGIVHRDLKPSNVMVGEFGEVLTLDWGVAVLAGSGRGEVAGTPRYMAPEQLRGEGDAQSDVYSLGAMLQDLLPEQAPAPLRSILAKAIQTDPQQRYQSAAELREDLSRFLDRERVLAHPETILEKAGRIASNYRVLIGLVLAYLVMRGLLLWWNR